MLANGNLWKAIFLYLWLFSCASAEPLSLPSWNLFSDQVEAQNARTSTRYVSKASAPQGNMQKSNIREPSDNPDGMPNDLVIRNMIGQMILIGFPGRTRDPSWQVRVPQLLRDGKIGGVILFSENIDDPGQVKRLTDALAADAMPQPLICVDQEGGTIQRLTVSKDFVGLPGAQQIAAMTPVQAMQFYRRSANEMVRLGINCNFGPVVDLNIDPNNPAIGKLGRSYDRDPRRVVSYSRLFIDAYRRAGVLTAAKHFPGHGSSQSDPHERAVDITRTWREIELEPFRSLIRDDPPDMIMVGHLNHPRFSDADRPASLSQLAINYELRDKLEYHGLVMSDDLDMGAIHNRYGLEQAAVMAIEAGNDLIIVANTKWPDSLIADRIINAVSRAVAQGRISRESIEQSYGRILAAKRKLAERRAYFVQSGVQAQ